MGVPQSGLPVLALPQRVSLTVSPPAPARSVTQTWPNLTQTSGVSRARFCRYLPGSSGPPFSFIFFLSGSDPGLRHARCARVLPSRRGPCCSPSPNPACRAGSRSGRSCPIDYQSGREKKWPLLLPAAAALKLLGFA